MSIIAGGLAAVLVWLICKVVSFLYKRFVKKYFSPMNTNKYKVGIIFSDNVTTSNMPIIIEKTKYYLQNRDMATTMLFSHATSTYVSCELETLAKELDTKFAIVDGDDLSHCDSFIVFTTKGDREVEDLVSFLHESNLPTRVVLV